VVGVGLLYQQGYFRQVLDQNGVQQALYPFNDPGQLPITPLRQENGEWLRLEIALPGHSVWLRAWQVLAQLTPRFSASRTVREYTERHYLPAAAAYLKRVADQGAMARQIVDWEHTLKEKWSTLRFGEVKVQTGDEHHLFEVEVYLDELDPGCVRVELYADGLNEEAPLRQEMQSQHPLTGTSGGYVYSAAVAAGRPATDYTARVIPSCGGIAIPLENARILWQR
jgi:starch phosphorylase